MTATSAAPDAANQAAAQPRARTWRLGPRRNPWGRPWFLEGFTWLYLIWSLVPIALAVLFSFNNGKSQAAWLAAALVAVTSPPATSGSSPPRSRSSG